VRLTCSGGGRIAGNHRRNLFLRHRHADFWRRPSAKYPEHGQRFTGEPAYFKHITEAAKTLLDASHTTPADYQYAVFPPAKH